MLTRHLPADFGGNRFLVSPDAQLSFWKPRIDSDLFNFAREYVSPGAVVWDVGANVGLFTFAAAQRAGSSGQVISIEPDTWLTGLLRRSAAMQPKTSASIQILPAAVSDTNKIAEFYIASRGRASNYLHEAGGASQTGGIRVRNHIVTVSLDWLLDQGQPPNVVKIDVEGAEVGALTGAKRVLRDARPVILCEVYREHSPAVTRLFREHSYELYDWETPDRRSVAEACYSTLALPRT